MPPADLSRRSVLASSLALAACSAAPPIPAQTPVSIPPLKSVAPFPIGVCVRSDQITDPAWATLAREQISQLTPEWEMKMEYILSEEPHLRFDGPDRIADFAAEHGMRLFGHTLIWYSQTSPRFNTLLGDEFIAAYDDYIRTVVGRYRGRAVGWDVVNEAVAEDGEGLRDCIWSERLGQDGYIVRAFQQARAADRDAVLFLNDYNLENIPKKGATFLKLVERLLKVGAPVDGIGTQSHLNIEIPAGQITAFMRDAASLGLKIHVSEVDASLRREGSGDRRTPEERLAQQEARVVELAEAFMAVPQAQRFAFTIWGLRDLDTWIAREKAPDAAPVLFDGEGRAKPVAAAVARAFQG